jgi:hypothetical protein
MTLHFSHCSYCRPVSLQGSRRIVGNLRELGDLVSRLWDGQVRTLSTFWHIVYLILKNRNEQGQCSSVVPTYPGLLNGGKSCFSNCTETQGSCSWCGTGMCCRKGWEDKSNGCDGTLGIPGEGHVCVAPGSTTVDNACFDTIQGTQFSSK